MIFPFGTLSIYLTFVNLNELTMKSITVESNENDFLIRIDKDLIDKDLLIELVDRFRLETLIRKADISEDIEDIGEEIKAEWWERNKDRILGYREQ